MRLEIYSKPDCALCDEAKDVLLKVRQLIPFDLVEVNIEEDPVLQERYRCDIPVILVNGRKAFKHRVDEKALIRRLEREFEP